MDSLKDQKMQKALVWSVWNKLEKIWCSNITTIYARNVSRTLTMLREKLPLPSSEGHQGQYSHKNEH